MNYEEMDSAVNDAETTLRFADLCAKRVARLLCGRFRIIDDPYLLAALKRELSEFNAVTKEWKN